MNEQYQELESIFHKVLVLRSVASLLRWDSEVVMPKKSHLLRAEQLASLYALTQELVLSENVEHLLKSQLSQKSQFDEWQQVNLELMARQYQRLRALPQRLIHKINDATLIAESAWLEARKTGHFPTFEPAFAQLLILVQEKAKRLGDIIGVSPFEALMDEHDPQRKEMDVDNLLNKIKPLFPHIIHKAQLHSEIAPIPISGRFRKRKQFTLCKELLRRMHFPLDQGRLDESIHPFTEGIAQDIRITTIFDRLNPLDTLNGLIHELGHALYDNFLPKRYRFQLVGQDAGMVIHEGVALFWEKMIGTSPAFTQWLSTYLQQHFGKAPFWEAKNIYHLLTQINPQLPRMKADEVCYMGHIILRYEIEKALFNNQIAAKDIPAFWEEHIQKLLGIKPINPGQDCLQDIHWTHGYFGYFHTYGLGFLFAAQLHEYLKNHHHTVFDGIRTGDFSALLQWLKEHLFQWGAFYSTNKMIEKLTESPLKCEPYINYLKEKYHFSDFAS